MKASSALREYLKRQGIDASDPWYRMPILGFRVPLFRIKGRIKEALTAHDIHHLVTGYDTGLKGECELCAWELGSGGCHGYLAFWLDRLLFAPIAVVCAPIRFLRAFRAGLGSRNTFAVNKEELLGMEMDDVRRLVGIEPPADQPGSAV